MLENDTAYAKVFKVLEEVYGDKVPIGTQLREFHNEKQVPGKRISRKDLGDVL